MKNTLKIKKGPQFKNGGSAVLVKHTQKTLSDAKKVKKKTESAVKKLNKAIDTFKGTLKNLSTGPKKKKRKNKTKKTTPTPTPTPEEPPVEETSSTPEEPPVEETSSTPEEPSP